MPLPDLRPRPGDLEPIEAATHDEIAALQLDRLQWTLQHAYQNVPFYRRSFDEAGVLHQVADPGHELVMCVAEWWHGAVGIASRIDQRLTEDVARTLGLLREELALGALRAELELFRGELAMTAAEHAAPAIEPASYAT